MKRIINRDEKNPYDLCQIHDVLSGRAKYEGDKHSDIKLTWDKPKVKRWKPEAGEKYFYIELGYHEGFVIDYRWSGYHSTDIKHYRLGNCFRTRKEAETKLKEIKKLLRGNNG